MIVIYLEIFMIEIFKSQYDSESIADIFRDLSECLDSRYNPKAKVLQNIDIDDVSYHVTFKFTNPDGEEQILFNKIYDTYDIIDLEQHIYDYLPDIKAVPDKHGFHEGDIDILIEIPDIE